jgi:(R,R)-butanediol dehydrogenase / meso-butanediol dehydrogenase / diacetyl reductase
MALTQHCVNRSQARTADKVIVLGAGPIGLGALIWLKLRGVRHVAVADVNPRAPADGPGRRCGCGHRLLPRERDRPAHRTARPQHQRTRRGPPGHRHLHRRDPDTGAAAVNIALRAAKWGAKLVTVAVHSNSEPIDLGALLRSEVTIMAALGYPTEIFEVTPQPAEYQLRFSRLISHRVPLSQTGRTFHLALTPGAAGKVVVTFDD